MENTMTNIKEVKCMSKIHEILENPFVEFLGKIFQKKYDFQKQLCYLHEIIVQIEKEEEKQKYVHVGILGKDDRICPFIHDFHKGVDESDEFNEIYHKFVQREIMPLVTKENKLVIQKTPNIRFSIPEYSAIGQNPKDDYEDIVGYHKDADFGHDEDEINFIVPLTAMYDSNSIYYETNIESNKFMNLKLDISQMFQGYLNQLHHYNKRNETKHTRISFDLRVMEYEKYMKKREKFANTKFELGKYYIVLESISL